MANVNRSRTIKRGKSLLDVYVRYGRLPELSGFVKDYYAITDSVKYNRSHIVATIAILKELYEDVRSKGRVQKYMALPI